MNDADADLRELFAGPGAAAAAPKRFRTLSRRGRLLLALPMRGPEAALAMDLYPAQKPLARMAKSALQTVAHFRIPFPPAALTLPIRHDSLFAQFLERLAPGCLSADGGLGILAGNPNAKGRRFILLLFAADHPVAIVKAGVSEEARALIAQEADFLTSTTKPGVERVLDTFEADSVAAFAIRHVVGEAPVHAAAPVLRQLLGGWLDSESSIGLDATPAWSRLSGACSENPLFDKVRPALAERQIHPALTHGDFAPWNIKVHPRTGTWQVFDWERGELAGIPGWDWLHFEVQPAVLVRNEAPAAIVARLDRLFEDAEFKAYLESAGLSGVGQSLSVAYLLHCLHVQRQTEGGSKIEALLQHAVSRWNV